MKTILKGIIMSIVNSALFTMLCGIVILFSKNNVEIGPLILVAPYIIIYIFEKKYKIEPNISIVDSLGTIFIMFGVTIMTWYCGKSDFMDPDDSLAFSGYMFIYMIWIFIPFVIKIIIAKWKLHKGLQKTEK